jgi:DNA-binding NarL/FixJ family response regulator
MSQKQAIRVLIADEHPIVRAGLAALLEIDPKANNGRDAVELFAQLAQRMNSPELSQRECEILQLMTAGTSNLAIGEVLNYYGGYRQLSHQQYLKQVER